MNKEKVLNTATRFFGKLSNVKENIYKGELRIQSEQPAGIYYLDLNNQIPLNFPEYQEDLLAEEYYLKPGSIQWNYYLLFIQDKKDDAEKKLVESNEKYARKFVLDEAEFEVYFKIGPSSQSGSLNIVSQLTKRLDEVGLYDVYTNESYVQTIDKFRHGKAIRTGKVFTTDSQLDPPKISFVKSINLKSEYRKWPKEIRKFEFGKVNLFSGINGVGKTSVFEAIELMICGRTLRNGSPKEPAGCIEAIFNDSILEKRFLPADNRLYQARDAAWFAKVYGRENQMPYSFNRYNFYNSDAAFAFSSSTDEKTIHEALKTIIFGQEYNLIIERVKKLFPEFRREYNKIQAEMDSAENGILVANKKISDMKENNSMLELEKAIENKYLSLSFIKKDLSVKEHYTEIEQLNNGIQILLSQITELSGGKMENVLQINKAIIKSQEEGKITSEFKGLEDSLTKEIDKFNEQEAELRKNLETLNRAKKYFTDIRLFNLEELTKQLQTSNENIRKLNLLQKSLGNIDLTLFRFETPISDLIKSTGLSLEGKNIAFKQIEREMDNLVKQFGEIEKILKEIKLLGLDYVKQQENIKECPLCHAPFERQELLDRINRMNESNTDDLSSLHERRKLIKDDLDSIDQFLNNLLKINIAFQYLDSKAAVDLPLQEMVDLILNFLKTKPETDSQKENIDSIFELAQSLDASEAEFISLGQIINESFHNKLNFAYENKTEFENTEEEVSNEIVRLSKLVSVRRAEKERLFEEMKAKLNIKGLESQSFEQIIQAIRDESITLGRLSNYISKLLDQIVLKDSDSFDDLEILSKTLAKNIESYKTEQRNQFELEDAKKKKLEYSSFIDKNKDLLNRFKKAYHLLKSLAEGDEDKDLKDFFAINMRELIDIFKSIHAPDEFQDILFQDGLLKLKPKEGIARSVTEISTGQRSALALSFFISLNRKLKMGPDIIMFDDPVSFVDDLNVLSFLDYLRFFVLKEGKQIFFATANKRLSSLFEHKFGFLGETEFKKWHFQR